MRDFHRKSVGVVFLRDSARSIGLALLCLSAPLAVSAQAIGTPTQPTGPLRPLPTASPTPQTVAVLPAESLGPDDLIEVMVSYCPELTRNFRVSSDGTLALPLLHQKLKVAGMTPIQVADSLKGALEQEGVLADAIVNISVLEYRSRPVSIVGAVNHPLTFQATGETSLLDGIATAGGLSPTAGGNIIVTIRRASTTSASDNVVQVIPVRDLISGANPVLNIKLRGGEEIRVPEASKIFVAGNVRRPGMYPMQSGADTTVVEAIALSMGLDSYSSSNVFIYRRRNAGPERDELKVPLKLILSHKAPDVSLMADDILYVPGSDGKRITSRVLGQLAGFGQSAGAGMLIYK